MIHGSDCRAELPPRARRALEATRTVPVTIAELRVANAFSGATLATQRCGFALLATVRIAAAAHAHGKVLVAMPLESKLYFPDVSPRTLGAFKDLVRWQEFTEATPEAS